MAGGYGPLLPIGIDAEDGFALTKTVVEQIKQNFKNLVLTVPGERVMKPSFGVGLKRYLFEQNTLQLREEISTKIVEQAKAYMPFIRIEDIIFSDVESPISDENTLMIKIIYHITPLNITDMLAVDDAGDELVLAPFDPSDGILL